MGSDITEALGKIGDEAERTGRHIDQAARATARGVEKILTSLELPGKARDEIYRGIMPTPITPTSVVQREARTALADYNERRQMAGSRGKSNMGIEQLKPLPSMQGPRLGAKLG
jgi:hypothetical protein